MNNKYFTRKLLVLLWFLLPFHLFANEVVEVNFKKDLEYHNHDTYEVWYDIDFKNPTFVIWTLTFEDAESSDATNNTRPSGNFVKCKSAPRPDYSNYNKNNSGSILDKGHMCPNNDRDWSVESAKNTFRACNICPQHNKLNRGIWQKYEKYAHELANKYMSVTIVCGPIYGKDLRRVGKNNSVLPEAFFKVFIYNGEIQEVYIFSNDENANIQKVDIEEIKNLTGLTFCLK